MDRGEFLDNWRMFTRIESNYKDDIHARLFKQVKALLRRIVYQIVQRLTKGLEIILSFLSFSPYTFDMFW